jgi:hypothetical protein
MLLNSFLDAPVVTVERDRIFLELLGHLHYGKKLSSPGAKWVAQDLTSRGVSLRNLKHFSPAHYPQILRRRVTRDHEEEVYVLAEINRARQRVKASIGEDCDLAISERVWVEWRRAADLEVAIDRLQAGPSRHAGSVVITYEESCTVSRIAMTPYLALISVAGQEFLATYEQILMIKDCSLQRANVFLALNQTLDIGYDEEMVDSVLRWEERCWLRYGEKGADILKGLESITRAALTEKTCPVFAGPDGTLELQAEPLRRKEILMGGDPLDLEVDRLLAILRPMTVEQTLETFGLLKMTCHPSIDPVKGGLSAAEEARTPDLATQESIDRLQANWRRLYVTGYIDKYRRWPELAFTDNRCALYRAYVTENARAAKSGAPLMDWLKFNFVQHAEFDYFPDWTELQDDRSISFERDQVAATWKKMKTRTERRLFIELLKRTEFSVKSFFDRIGASDGVVPYEWRIVSLYPKEREFKRKARMFALLTIEMRCVLNCMEANIADKILCCFREQTMIESRDTVIKRFLNSTKSKELESLFIEVDFHRWCLRWREAPILPCMRDLEDIFGVKHHFSIIQSFFAQSMIVVRHPACEPEGITRSHPPESDLLWYNHSGGFEGLAQKFWSIMTYSFCDLAMQDVGLPYQLTGQGDNQVLVVDVRSMNKDIESIKALGRRSTERIEEEGARVGQVIKPDECLYSTTVISYAKDFFIDGSLIPTSLKACSRIFFRSVDDMPACASRITGVFSTAAGAAARSRDTLVPYFIAHAVCARSFFAALKNNTWWVAALAPQKHLLRQPEMLADVLSAPPALGGVALSVADFLYRGGGDSATKELAPIVREQSNSPWMWFVSAVLSGEIPADADLARLIEAPAALPVPTAPSYGGMIKAEMLASARAIARNKDLVPILAASVSDAESDFRAALTSVSPFNPYIMHDIYKNSAFGVRDEVFTLVSCSRTAIALRAMASNSEDMDSIDINAMTLAQDSRTLIYLVDLCGLMWDRMRSRPPPPMHRTAFETVTALRKLYKADVVGVTTATPLDYEELAPESCEPYIGLVFPEGASRSLAKVRGFLPPLMGMLTSARRHSYGYKIAATGKAERSLAKLAEIRETVATPEMQQLVDVAINSRTRIDMTQYTTHLSKRVGGTIDHRYLSALKDRGSDANGAETLSTRALADSNHAGVLAGGEKDYPIMFQEFWAYAMAKVARSRRVVYRYRIAAPQDLPVIRSLDSVVVGHAARPVPSYDSALVRVSELILLVGVGAKSLAGTVPERPERLSVSGIVSAAFMRRVRYDLPSATASTRSSLKLDFAEMQRMTLRRMIDAIALTCIFEVAPAVLVSGNSSLPSVRAAIQDTARPLIDDWLRDPALYPLIFAQIRAIGGCTSSTRYAATPMLNSDLVLTQVLDRSLVLLQTGSYHPPLLCSDDDDRVTTASLLGSLGCAVLAALLEDPASGTVARDAYRVRIGLLRRARGASADQLSIEILEGAIAIREAARRASLPALHRRVDLALRQGLAWTTKHPLAAVVRRLRVLPVPPTPAAVVRAPELRTVPVRFEGDLETSIIARRARSLGGGASSAHSAWYGPLRALSSAEVVIIGVGEGASAAVAAACGARSIRGIDKTADLSTASLTTSVSVPGLLATSGREAFFSRLSCQFDTDGMWPEDYVCACIEKETMAGSPLVLDYSTDIATLAQDFEARDRWAPGRTLLKRVIVREGVGIEQLQFLHHETDVRVTVSFSSSSLIEAVLTSAPRTSVFMIGTRIDAIPTQATRIAAMIPPRTESIIENTLRLHGLQLSSTWAEASVVLVEGLDARRRGYMSWGSLLHAAAIVHILQADDPYRAAARIFETGLPIGIHHLPLARSRESHLLLQCLLPKVVFERAQREHADFLT